MSRKIPGVNIQWPWSRLIVEGKKTVETRTYSLPKKYIGQELAIIETPGPHGKWQGINKAQIIGTVIFEKTFRYDYKTWKSDHLRHFVFPDDPQFKWNDKNEKWGWVVSKVNLFKEPLPAPKKRGIIFASECEI